MATLVMSLVAIVLLLHSFQSAFCVPLKASSSTRYDWSVQRVKRRSSPEVECPGFRRILALCPVITTVGLCGYLPPACERLILRRSRCLQMKRRHSRRHGQSGGRKETGRRAYPLRAIYLSCRHQRG